MCCKKDFGCLILVIISVIIGILVGIAFGTGIITGIIAALWTVLGIAILAILTLLGIAIFGRRDAEECLCRNGNCLLFGAIGTVIFSIVTLALTVSAIATAVLVGITAFFAILTILAFAKLIACLINEACYYKQ